MTAEVRDSYDAIAKRYAQLFLDDLEGDHDATRWLTRFAESAAGRTGGVVDLGCGPGHVVQYLHGLGLTVAGHDLSPGQIAEARAAFPELDFEVGDFTSLPFADRSLGGIVSRYSLIHLPPSRLGEVFAHWLRLLEPGAPMLLSFFGSASPDAHGSPFDHRVVTAYELCPTRVAVDLGALGFVDVEVGVAPAPEGGRPFTQATILAVAPTA